LQERPGLWVARDDTLEVAHSQMGPAKPGCDVIEGMELVGQAAPEHDVADDHQLDGILAGDKRLIVAQVKPGISRQIGWIARHRAEEKENGDQGDQDQAGGEDQGGSAGGAHAIPRLRSG
jgi:hypothetical protein